MNGTNPLEILEDLLDDDPFIRTYPLFQRYIDEWDERGGNEAEKVPSELIFEFYAEKLFVDDALAIWFAYHA